MKTDPYDAWLWEGPYTEPEIEEEEELIFFCEQCDKETHENKLIIHKKARLCGKECITEWEKYG